MSGGTSLGALFVEGRERAGIGARDPRVRLAGGLALLVVLPFLDRPLPLAAAIGIGVLAVVAARIPIGEVLRRLAVAEGFLLALLLTLPFVVPGQPVFAVFGLVASLEGLGRALVIVVRLHAAVLVITALLWGMGSRRLAAAMSGLGMPAGITTLLNLTMRYIATLGDEYRRLRTAMRVRGFRLRSNLHTWRSLGYLVGMMLVRSLERAERVHRAMLCRGYSGRFPVPAQTPLRAQDLTFLAVVGLAVGGLIGLELLA